MKDSQRGGIASFVIVALVLTGLLTAGLYLSKHMARVAHDSPKTTTQVATNDKQAAPDTKNSTDTKKTETPAPEAAKPAPTQPQQTAPATPAPSAVATVPETGPSEFIALMIVMGVLAFAGYSFVQNRTRFKRSALHK